MATETYAPTDDLRLFEERSAGTESRTMSQRVADSLSGSGALTMGSAAPAAEPKGLELHAPETAPRADVIREAGAPPEKPAQAEDLPTAKSLTQMYDRLHASLAETTAPWTQAFIDATTRGEAAREGEVRPALEGVKAAAGVAVPGAPARETLPKVPSQKPREFLDAHGKGVLGALVNTLGLIGQMYAGTKAGAPLAAVSALTGAMHGWAKGDDVRAEREWREYLAQAEKIRTENDEALKFHAAALNASAGNMAQAQARLAAALGTAGLEDHRATVALQGLQIAGQQWDREAGLIRDLNRDTIGFMQWKEERALKETMAKWMMTYQAGLLDVKRGEKVSPFDDETMTTAAQMYILKGTQPAFGMGASARPDRARFWKRVHDLAPEYGGVEGIAARQASISGLRQELQAVMRTRGLAEAFSGTARRNLADAQMLSKKVDRSGAPMINKWLLAGRKAWSGDKDVAEFDVAVRTAINEVARVLNSATGAGVISDNARREIEEMLSSALNKEQFLAVTQRLNKEMENRRAAYDAEVDHIQKLLRETGQPDEKAGAGAPARRYNPATGKIE